MYSKFLSLISYIYILESLDQNIIFSHTNSGEEKILHFVFIVHIIFNFKSNIYTFLSTDHIYILLFTTNGILKIQKLLIFLFINFQFHKLIL
ncbi:hypothetical protein HOB94_00620 [bacterium]|nr:hypothetical protein [bacterium]MBT6778680.1 hypothetical protein [bacterium]